ncbi:Hypothetical predicted protein, partial [Pelobates cultripes]
NNTHPWRLNDTLLTKPDTATTIQKDIEAYFTDNPPEDTSVEIVWQAHKDVIRGTSIKLASYQQEQRKQRYIQLINDITDLTHKNKLYPSKDTQTQLTALQKDGS